MDPSISITTHLCDASESLVLHSTVLIVPNRWYTELVGRGAGVEVPTAPVSE